MTIKIDHCLVLIVLLLPWNVTARIRTSASVTANVSTTPTVAQAVEQPVGAESSSKDPANVRYVTSSWNWSQSVSVDLSLPGSEKTIFLAPCPVGIDVSANAQRPFYVYIPTTEAEAALVTGGTCTSGGVSGTIIVTTGVAHSATTNTIESAYHGIQEAILYECGTNASQSNNSNCHVIIPPSGPIDPASSYPNHHFNLFADYNIYATIYFQANQSELSGYGVTLNCYERDVCLQVGDLLSANHYANNTIEGLQFRTPWNTQSGASGLYGYGFAGCGVTSTQRLSQVATIKTGRCTHHFRVGDRVTIMFTDDTRFWGDAVVTSVPTSTSFRYEHAGADIAMQNTPGVVAQAFSAIYDNANNTKFNDIAYDFADEIGSFNTFFTFQDDENAKISGFTNNAISLQHTSTWSGSFIQSIGNIAVNPAPPVSQTNDSS